MIIPRYRSRENFYRVAVKLGTLKDLGVVGLMPSGTSSFVMLFSTEDEKEQAKKLIATFRVDDEKPESALTVENFGDDTRPTFWLIDMLGCERQALRKGIKAAVAQIEGVKPNIPTFKIRTMQHNGAFTQRNVIRFDGKMRWLGKRIFVNNEERLVTQEGRRCQFCKKEGHSCWDCKGLSHGFALVDRAKSSDPDASMLDQPSVDPS